MRLNNSSTQVYMALKPDERIDESTGDLLFSSTAPLFRTELLLSRDITSRTYSFYYPRTRPEGRPRCLIVSSTNANYDDWAKLNAEEYEASKHDLVETTLDALDKYVPNIRERLDHVEASTPVTFEHYTQARQRRELRHQVRRPGREPRAAAADHRPVPRRQRRHHHVRLAGGDELRRDRGERGRQPADEQRIESIHGIDCVNQPRINADKRR